MPRGSPENKASKDTKKWLNLKLKEVAQPEA